MPSDKKPISKVTQLVHERVQESLSGLGGLEDAHLKYLSYFLKHELSIENFRLKIDCNSVPKLITIRCFSIDWQTEIIVKPKQADILDKIAAWLCLDQWKIEFAKEI